ncbi:MAG: YqaJ-like viral recombinase domain protein [Syntrophaceae bacterium PtaB.Bin038]|nr:MAG: YqaJ-like viral recombinase domain protein [Syntrophaceae bacterium PtaB.Bin038]
MKVYNQIIQGTPEWYAVRSGKFTASEDFQQLVTGRKDTVDKLIRKKAAERITGQCVLSDYTNAAMERGRLLEQEAVDLFEMSEGLAVQRVGFIEGSDWHGASPDGLIGDNAGIEIKSRDIHTHLACFLEGYDKAYKWQIQGNLYVAEREFWYFVSYNPHYAHIGKHLYIEKIPRDEALIAQIKAGIEQGMDAVTKVMRVFIS